MFCKNCGKVLSDNAKFCDACGTAVTHFAENVENDGNTNRSQTGTEIPDSWEKGGTIVPDPKGKSSAPLIIGLIAGVLLLAGGIGLFAAFRLGLIGSKTSDTVAEEESMAEEKSAASDSVTPEGVSLDTDTTATDTPDAQAEGEAPEQGNDYDSISKWGENKQSVTLSLVSTDVSEFPLVKLYLDVTDAGGNQVELTPTAKGALREVSGGKYIEREVKKMEKLEGNEGISIELIADKSGSMYERMEQVKQVMLQFVKSLDYLSGDQVELISFDSYVMYMCTETGNASLLNNGISNMVATGDTALYDALYEGLLNAGYRKGARCVIAFTDGLDNMSIHTPEEIIRMAQERSVAVYIIGTDRQGGDVLRQITDSTRGQYWNIDDLADMGTILDAIYTEQKEYYCFEYMSDTTIDQYAKRSVDCIIGDDQYSGRIVTDFTPVKALEVQAHTSRYEIIPADVSWTEANQQCMQRGGHLATITSETEMNELIRQGEACGLKYLWIGGYTSVNASQTFGHWVTGEPFDYTAWYDGEPSRNDEDGTPEMYLMMWKVKDEWSWNDQRNDPAADLSYFIGNIGYICEYEE